jgi:hypothetical protein
VRQFDYENYLCTFALPKEYRATAIAVRAFNGTDKKLTLVHFSAQLEPCMTLKSIVHNLHTL